MARWIDADAAIDALGEEPEVWSGKDEYEMGLNNQWNHDVTALKSLPPADVAPVRHGQMRYKAAYKGAEFGFYFCSECGQPFWWGSLNFCPHRYCPHCGAKMDGGAIGDPMEDE